MSIQEDMRSRILAAAGTILLAKGYDATTTSEIAALAKTSKRALYEHFADKQEILTELIRTRSREMRTPIALHAPASKPAFFETLRRFGEVFLTKLFAPTTTELYRLAISSAKQSGEIGQAILLSGHSEIVQAARAFFEEGAALGHMKREDVALAFELYFNMLLGQVQIRQLLGVEKPPSRPVLRARSDQAATVLERFIG